MSFEFAVQKLVYGGEALGHYLGKPVLVPRALPGERLEVEAVRTAKGVVHATPLTIIEASPERVDPPCAYFGRCGGCHYQHLNPEHQPAAKREILRETLRRIGKIAWELEIPIHAAHPWHYRNQAQFKLKPSDDGRVSIGFFEPGTHRIVPIDACLILSPRLNTILETLRHPAWSGQLPDLPCKLLPCNEIEALVDDADEKVMLAVRGHMGRVETERLAVELLEGLPGAQTIALEGGGRTKIFGENALHYRVGDFRYQVSPGSFFQASRFLLSQFVSAVTAGERGDVVLDLFAGVGLFTLPLAQRFGTVVGVESNPSSASDLAANARTYGFQNVRVAAEFAFDFMRRYARAEPDLVVLDPPREGVGTPTLKLLAMLRPTRIHYVSCNPPTLARDLGYLLSQGYGLNSIELFDFFPQTYHIECLANLSRNTLRIVPAAP